MTTMNLPAVLATSLLILLLHLLLLLLSASSSPRVCLSLISTPCSVLKEWLGGRNLGFEGVLPSKSQDILFEEKTRLGSTPPSCHNKCNQCHPCKAEQVPSMPGFATRLGSPSDLPMGIFDSSPQGNSYSFYKPLGWKCCCGNHLFNP